MSAVTSYRTCTVLSSLQPCPMHLGPAISVVSRHHAANPGGQVVHVAEGGRVKQLVRNFLLRDNHGAVFPLKPLTSDHSGRWL
uniref:Uncharacterized protein n=1 Tax=Anguilla anguilla TaxID=7936 RepID=A0A0E9T880_ANGAN